MAEFGVVSGSLALMTNIVMGYNAGQLQKSIDAEVANGVDLTACVRASEKQGIQLRATMRHRTIQNATF